MADPASLQNLHDIVMPSPAPWWPPAPGWYLVFSGAAVVAAWFCWQRFRQWRADAYRRASLNELARIKGLIDSGEREPAMRKLPELIKRTAMSVWPREQVAAMSGTGWLKFLDETGNMNAFSQGDGGLLAEMAYAGDNKLQEIPDDRIQYLMQIIEKWIREHRAG
jgi:hypothetical protein